MRTALFLVVFYVIMRSASHLVILITLILLALFGVAYIYSTGYIGSDYPVRPNWLRQCVFLAVGASAAIIFARMDNQKRSWQALIIGCYLLSVLLLVAVLLVGRSVGGARRWIALGPLFLQPAEFAKVFTLLAGALVLSGELFHRKWLELPVALGVFALPMLLIAREPSYGNAASVLPGLLLMLGMRYLPAWLWRCAIAAFMLAFFAGIAGLYYLRALPPEPPPSQTVVQDDTGGIKSLLRGYHLKRLKSYLSARGGWNEQQSLMTVAGGGLVGKGYLNGTMKSLGFLPRTVAPTDFIFAVIAEEGGFLFGVLPVVILYGVLILILMHWASRAQSQLALNILVAGTSLLMVHICVGIGMTIRLLPVIGLPLPLLSYGGSFTVAMLTMIGAMLSCDRAVLSQDAGERNEDAPAVFHLPPILRIRLWRQ
jgi:rod shape determining protein RodA